MCVKEWLGKVKKREKKRRVTPGRIRKKKDKIRNGVSRKKKKEEEEK